MTKETLGVIREVAKLAIREANLFAEVRAKEIIKIWDERRTSSTAWFPASYHEALNWRGYDEAIADEICERLKSASSKKEAAYILGKLEYVNSSCPTHNGPQWPRGFVEWVLGKFE